MRCLAERRHSGPGRADHDPAHLDVVPSVTTSQKGAAIGIHHIDEKPPQARRVMRESSAARRCVSCTPTARVTIELCCEGDASIWRMLSSRASAEVPRRDEIKR